MFPAFATHNSINCRPASFVFPRKFIAPFAYGKLSAYFNNLARSQFRMPIFLSFCPTMSVLLVHIKDVFLMGAQPKVSRIYAPAIIARMANLFSLGDRPVVKFIARSVRCVSPFANSEPSIPIFVERAIPRPALIWGTLRGMQPQGFTERRRCFRVFPSGELPGIVAGYIADWLPLDSASFSAGFARNGSALPTTAVAVAVGDFLSWIAGNSCKEWDLRGMLRHVNASFVGVGRARGCYQQRPGVSIGSYKSILAQMSVLGKDSFEARRGWAANANDSAVVEPSGYTRLDEFLAGVQP